MEIVTNYLPAVIEFTATTSEVPQSLGTFTTSEEAQKFMSDNFIATPKHIETNRLMDEHEKEYIRNEYIVEIEERYPKYQQQLIDRSSETEQAKESEKKAKETVAASFNKIEMLSKEVKKGTTDINLDQATTYEVSYKGNYYYYSLVNAELKLAKVSIIPEYELSDLFNSSERNKLFFDGLKNIKKAN